MGLGRFCSVAVLAACLLGASAITASSAKDIQRSPQAVLPVPRATSASIRSCETSAPRPTKDNDVAWGLHPLGPSG